MKRVSVVDSTGRVILYRVIPGHHLVIQEGERIIADNPPEFNPDYQTCTRVEPVNLDATSMAYVVEYKDMSIVRQKKLEELKVLRDRKEATTFTYLEHPFDCDPRSVQRINTAVQAAQAALSLGQPFQLLWTDANNVDVPMNAQDLLGMPVALALHGNAVHDLYKVAKQAVTAALTPEEVISIGLE